MALSTKKKFWVTKSGDKILLKDLSDSHLRNIIRFLRVAYRRKLLIQAQVADCAYPDGEPDGAAMAADAEARYAYDEAYQQEDIEESLPGFNLLLEELEKRNLKEHVLN